MSTIRKAVIAPTEHRHRQYPASSAMPVMLFPLVDRDGLTKPLLQIIAEEAIDSGIESVAVIASADEARACRDYFRRWPQETARSLRGQDWAMLQSEKLALLGERLTFIQPRDDSKLDALAAREFVGSESFLLLPATNVFLSGSKDRCAGQLLSHAARQPAASFTLVRSVRQVDFPQSMVVQASVMDPARGIFAMHAVVDRPTIEQANSLTSPDLPIGQFFAQTGMGVFGPQYFDALETVAADSTALAQRVLIDRFHQSFCVAIHGEVFDASRPYGLLETQLGLGLAGIHRIEICEMITRTLAGQAKS